MYALLARIVMELDQTQSIEPLSISKTVRTMAFVRSALGWHPGSHTDLYQPDKLDWNTDQALCETAADHSNLGDSVDFEEGSIRSANSASTGDTPESALSSPPPRGSIVAVAGEKEAGLDNSSSHSFLTLFPREKTKSSQPLSPIPSGLDTFDYWLRFDSDDEIVDPPANPSGPISTSSGRQLSPQPSVLRQRKRVEEPTEFTVAPPTSFKRTAEADLVFPTQADDDDDEEEDFLNLTMAKSMESADASLSLGGAASRDDFSNLAQWERQAAGQTSGSYRMQRSSMSEQERQHLLAVAMGGYTGAAGLHTQLGIGFEYDFDPSKDQFGIVGDPGFSFPPDMQGATPNATSANTAASAAASSKDKEKGKSNERAAHNDIERKYRTNLKDKIAELRDAIPALRHVPTEDEEGEEGPSTSSAPAPKVSKGAILSRATEYIQQLEKESRSLTEKNEKLARRLRAFEQLVGQGTRTGTWEPQGYGAQLFNPRGGFGT